MPQLGRQCNGKDERELRQAPGVMHSSAQRDKNVAFANSCARVRQPYLACFVPV